MNRLRIGIDALTLQGQPAGIGRYLACLCRELPFWLPQAEYFLYARTSPTLPLPSQNWHVRVEPSRMAGKMKNIFWLRFLSGRLCARDQLHVYWAVNGFFPHLPAGVRRVASVHDFTYRLFPRTMHVPTYCAFRGFWRKDVESADAILSVSSGTAARCPQYLSRGADAIVLPSAHPRFFTPPSSEDLARVQSRYAGQVPYFLTVASLEPRKNQALLIAVFLALKRSGALPRDLRLLLAGGEGWKFKHIYRELPAGGGRDWVKFLGYVPDEDLPALYAGCQAFIFPSLYEGFGSPVAEARACRARIIASDLPEIREAGGPDAIYIPPTAEGIADGLRCGLTMPRPSSVPAMASWRASARVLAQYLCPSLVALNDLGVSMTAS